MKTSRNWLKTFFDTDIPAASDLAELFTFHSFEVEGIRNIPASQDGPSDDILDLKILPDRAHYCLSHRGVAEEIHVMTGLPLKANRTQPPLMIIPADKKTTVLAPKISIITSPGQLDVQGLSCRRYMGRRIENVTVGESTEWMKAHLTAIGERSINNIVDATNIVMFDTGQPLHAFDADKVIGDIVIRAAKEGEKIMLLDGKEVALIAADHVIADDEGPLAIAGVKGGKRAHITTSTTAIIIEAANFDPTSVRRTATRLNLRNESSKRFENEITPELAADGMSMVSSLIAEIIPGTALSMSDIIDIYPGKPVQTVIEICRDYINSRLGIIVSEKACDDIFDRMGIAVNKKANQGQDSSGNLLLTIPFHRLDLSIPDDIVEEVGRIYGYDKIKTSLPAPSKKPIAIAPDFYLSEKIKNILTGRGFSEVYLYTLVGKGEVETAYPLAADKSFARANLTDGMMTCLEKNTHNGELLGLDTIAIFEIGRIFKKNTESIMLSLGVTHVGKHKKMKGNDTILAIVNLINEVLNEELNEKRNSEPHISIPIPAIISKGALYVCEINLSEVLKSYVPPSAASYADLGFGPASSHIYKKFSSYPFIVRDIAVFVPESVQAEEVWKVIQTAIDGSNADKNAPHPLLAKHFLFDTFRKDGKTSFAFRMIFQSMERTLTDEEVNVIMEATYADVKKNNWEVR